MIQVNVAHEIGTIGFTSHSESGDSNHIGNIENIIDNNVSTRYARRRVRGLVVIGTITSRVQATATVTWTTPYTVADVSYTWSTYRDGSSGVTYARRQHMQLLIDGTWTEIHGLLNRNNLQAITHSEIGPWDNVTGMRVRLEAQGGSSAFGGSQAQCTWWEMFAYVDAYAPIEQTRIQTLDGAMCLTEQKYPVPTQEPSFMRIRIDGEDKHIMLIDPDDPNASPLRVRTPEGIKSIPLMAP